MYKLKKYKEQNIMKKYYCSKNKISKREIIKY